MKHFTLKWLKRIWALIAVAIIITAILITITRFAISNVDNYKEILVEWIAEEHGVNVGAEKVSAGIDFSGLVLTLNNVTFIDSKVLPFELKIENLFLHFDFLESISKQRIVFNDISLKGADLLLKSIPKDPNAIPYGSLGPEPQTQSDITLEALKNIFLLRLSSFVISDSSLRFTDHLNKNKEVLIQELSWINNESRHQGVGKATLPNTTDEDNNLEFIINLTGDAEGANEQLVGTIFANAENLNVTDYLRPQVNPLADLKKAVTSFKLWGTFDFNGPKALQLSWGNSEISWSLLEQNYNWELNNGEMQFSYQQSHWLFDSYDLNITQDLIPTNDIKISGSGLVNDTANFDLSGINVSDIVPFAILFSNFDAAQTQQITAFEFGGQVNEFGLILDNQSDVNLSVAIGGFNSQSVGQFPAINDADIHITTNQNIGNARIQIGSQDINFNGEFNRVIPLQKADIELNWVNSAQGFELSSHKLEIKTDDIDSLSQFSFYFPSKESNSGDDLSPLLSLYSVTSLADGAKANHYYPMNIMGKEVYDYLLPTLKKGTINDAKILWNGPLGDFPFENNEGVFQALIPINDAEYDFYPGWQGLSDLDLVMLFENDALSMVSSNGKLGGVRLGKLSANIDHLTEEGILTVNGEVHEEARLLGDYLLNSPLKESVGNAIELIHIQDKVEGNLSLTIPLLTIENGTQAQGKLTLKDNAIDVYISSDSILPLKNVNGEFSFTNGDLVAESLTATLFKQPINFSFSSEDLDDKYQLHANFFGQWNVSQLSKDHKALAALKLAGNLDWEGRINFVQYKGKEYQFALSLDSQLQGVNVNLPAPFNKNALQSWPTKVSMSASPKQIKWVSSINNKLRTSGEMGYVKEKPIINYLYLGLGQNAGVEIDKTKQVIRINEDKVDLSPWLPVIKENLVSNDIEKGEASLFDIDTIYLDIKHAQLFEQPLVNLSAKIEKIKALQWNLDVTANELIAKVEYRQGIPDRYDININKLAFPLFNLDLLTEALSPGNDGLSEISDNLRTKYPEVFLTCSQCLYAEMDLSPLKMHIYPSSVSYNIDYLTIGEEGQATNVSGVWDQSRTNIITQSQAINNTSIINRLGYASPIVFDNGEFDGAFNWIGAPWQFNLDSLNGSLKVKVEDGLITEVDDKGARLLSFLSLDGIRRSLNLEFGNVFSKGLGFDDMSLSGTINNGIFKNDDYYLDGSAGKISGSGLIDLPNLNVNYRFSYSPAVTSSLPVLAAFAINPLTGAAVLMLTEIFEPVVDTIVRVDFSVKGSLLDPDVKLEDKRRGIVKLENSEVLEELEEQQINAQ